MRGYLAMKKAALAVHPTYPCTPANLIHLTECLCMRIKVSISVRRASMGVEAEWDDCQGRTECSVYLY